MTRASSPPELLIAGGLVIDPAGAEGVRDILIRRGKIAAIARGLARRARRLRRGVPTLDARGLWLLPGLIDMHVHLREPGQTDSETIATGTRAAAAGGVTTVLAMANTIPAIDTPARVRFVRDAAARGAAVRVLSAAAVTEGLQGRNLTRMEALAAAGAAAFSDDGRPVMDAALMRRALREARALSLPLLDHAEDDALTGCGVVHDGAFARRARVPGIPAASEAAMAARDIALAEAERAPLHLCHVSCAQTVALVRQAKERGVRVTAEAAPHHFTLVDEDIPDRDANFKMKPPLRSRADREALIAGLADGTIDAIATDHAPHAPALKARGLLRAPFGVIGLETLLPLSLALVRAGRLSRRRLAELLSAGPARLLGLRDRGSLRPGAEADLTVVDPRARWRFGASASKSRNSPFVGRALVGRAAATIVGGRIVYSVEER